MDSNHVEKVIRVLWGKGMKGTFSIYTDADLFYLNFSNEEDRSFFLQLGTIFISGRAFVLREWCIGVEKEKYNCKKIPIWVAFRKVPRYLWNRKGLSFLGSCLGTPQVVDFNTLKLKEDAHVRMKVELTPDHDFKPSLEIASDGWNLEVDVEYQWTPPTCKHCVCFGHNSDVCYKKPNVTEPDKVTEPEAEPHTILQSQSLNQNGLMDGEICTQNVAVEGEVMTQNVVVEGEATNGVATQDAQPLQNDITTSVAVDHTSDEALCQLKEITNVDQIQEEDQMAVTTPVDMQRQEGSTQANQSWLNVQNTSANAANTPKEPHGNVKQDAVVCPNQEGTIQEGAKGVHRELPTDAEVLAANQRLYAMGLMDSGVAPQNWETASKSSIELEYLAMGGILPESHLIKKSAKKTKKSAKKSRYHDDVDDESYTEDEWKKMKQKRKKEKKERRKARAKAAEEEEEFLSA